MEINYMVEKLRCISATGENRQPKCNRCKYRVLEEVSDKIPAPPDVEIDGKKYWQGCDYDRICLDAADLLDKIASTKNTKTPGTTKCFMCGKKVKIDAIGINGGIEYSCECGYAPRIRRLK